MNEQEEERSKIDISQLLEIDHGKFGRRFLGSKARKCLIYPDDNFRLFWDLIISM
jgi:hypothetical protein